MITILNHLQAREEKRLQVEPRVLWDVEVFKEGDDWRFAATNTGGVDVEGYDLEFEAVSFPMNRVGLDPRASALQTDRWGKRILRGESSSVNIVWTDDFRSLRARCSHLTGVTEASGPCVLGVRVTEVFHRANDYRRFHRARILIPIDGVLRPVDTIGRTTESIAVQRYFATKPSELLGRVPIEGEAAHPD